MGTRKAGRSVGGPPGASGSRCWRLAPFVVATVAGLVVLWPSHHYQPVPLQYQTYGSGKSVYEKGEVAAFTRRTCGGTASPGNTPSICSTAHVLLTSGPDRATSSRSTPAARRT